jgi:hypothetical protein
MSGIGKSNPETNDKPTARAGYPLPPWSVRMTRTVAGGPAVEVYVGESLVDVVVAAPWGRLLLSGACSAVVFGKPHTIAWGRLPVLGEPVPGLEFTRGRVFSRPRPVYADRIASWFWVAEAAGRFGRVTAVSRGKRESLRVWSLGRC